MTPGELLFRRQMRTKLPQISLKATDNFEVLARERDHVMKTKAKAYTELKRKANICDLQPQKPRDKVLLNQERVNKLSTAFEQVPCSVGEKRQCLVLQSSDGRTIKRNVTPVKRYIHDYHRQLTYYVDNDVLDCEFDYVVNQPIHVVQHDIFLQFTVLDITIGFQNPDLVMFNAVYLLAKWYLCRCSTSMDFPSMRIFKTFLNTFIIIGENDKLHTFRSVWDIIWPYQQ